MIAYAEALAILRGVDLQPAETLPLSKACGQISAQTLTSNMDLPPFANSAMDGFAVRTDSIDKPPLTLPVIGSSAAGDAPKSGGVNAWEIMTGAVVPKGYDSVIKIEDVDVLARKHDGQPGRIQINHKPEPGQNIRCAGTDFSKGDTVLIDGTFITPLHIMALAATGRAAVKVRRQPHVSILSTGKEIINNISAPLSPGQIYNSNAPYLSAMLGQLCAGHTFGGSIPDDPEMFKTRVSSLLSTTDLIISTGAVSAGRYDFIPDALRALGAEILFHKVAIRPGKPILYARLPSGTHYLGLPGNPISAAVGLRFFGIPLMQAMTGQAAEAPISVGLSHSFTKTHKLRFFAKAKLTLSETGVLQTALLTGQESYKIKPLLSMNAWAEIGEQDQALNIGDSVRIWPLMPGAFDFGGGD